MEVLVKTVRELPGGGILLEKRLYFLEERDIIELRKKTNWVKGAKGRFAGSVPMGGSAKMSFREKTRVSSQIATDYPMLPSGEKRYPYENRNHFYVFSVNGFGNYNFHFKIAIEGNESKIADIRKELKNGSE